jgi:hypothetical protein
MRKLPTREKLRAKLIRKGIFSQFPIYEEMRDYEGEIRLARSLLDRCLYEATAATSVERIDAFHFMNPDSSCAETFDYFSEIGLIYPEKARIMMLGFIEKFYPEVSVPFSCSST